MSVRGFNTKFIQLLEIIACISTSIDDREAKERYLILFEKEKSESKIVY